jgi:hypothetical protein
MLVGVLRVAMPVLVGMRMHMVMIVGMFVLVFAVHRVLLIISQYISILNEFTAVYLDVKRR